MGQFRLYTRLLLGWFAAVQPNGILAGEVAVGIAAVEEGDDRYRPASALQIGIGESFVSRIYTYGREHGPYSETTLVSGFAYRFPSFSNQIFAHVGGSLLMEETKYKTDENSAADETNSSNQKYNAGANFGLNYQMPLSWFYLSLNWDAHLYLAGTAGLLLATGRKHALSLTTGIDF